MLQTLLRLPFYTTGALVGFFFGYLYLGMYVVPFHAAQQAYLLFCTIISGLCSLLVRNCGSSYHVVFVYALHMEISILSMQ